VVDPSRESHGSHRKEESKLRILVVDDEESVREAICWALEGEHEVIGAGSGGEALDWFVAAIVPDNPFGIVLTDNTMPGMDGIELTRQIKMLRRATMVGMISGDYGVRAAAMEAGASGFLSKPLDVGALRAMVKGFAQVARAVARQVV